jgi:hypothetical protein
MRRVLSFALVLLICSTNSTTGHAEYLIGVARDNNVYRVSSDFKQVTKLAHLEAEWQFNCLAQDSTGRLFSFASMDGTQPRSSHLIELNPATGAVISDRNITDTLPDGTILAAAFGPDDTLYGINLVRLNGVLVQQFVKVDPDTGNTDILGQFSPSALIVTGMDFDSNGALFGWGTLNPGAKGIVRIDLGTLALQDIFAEPGEVRAQWAIAFDSQDQLVSGGLERIIKIDMPSGELGQSYNVPRVSFTGLEFIVPEPSTLSLGSFALISLAALRRRK